ELSALRLRRPEDAAFSRCDCDMDEFVERTFFVTSVTSERTPIFRSERAAKLFIETLYGCRERGTFQLYEFVLMPDHLHLLLAPAPLVSLEKAMQFIKGRILPSLHERDGLQDENMGNGASRII